MTGPRVWILCAVSALAFSGFLIGQQAEPPARADQEQLPVEHPECSFFGPQRERFVTDALQRMGAGRSSHKLTAVTDQVVHALAVNSGGASQRPHDQSYPAGSIDSYIF